MTASKWPEVETYLRRHRGLHKRNSLKGYAQAVKLLDEHDPRRMSQEALDQVKESVLRRFAHNTAAQHLNLLRTVLRHVYGRHDLVLKVPAYRPRVQHVLEVEQTERLLEAYRDDPCLNAALTVLYRCALRIGEVHRLDVADVRIEQREIVVRDAKRGNRAVGMDLNTVEQLSAWLKKRGTRLGALFENAAGQRLGEQSLRRYVKLAASRAGIKERITPHDLRASCATHLMNLGVNPKVVQRHLGHSNLRSTMIYDRPSMGQARAVMDEAWQRLAGPKDRSIEQIQMDAIEKVRAGRMTLDELRGILKLAEAAAGRDPSTEGVKGYA